LSHSLKRQGSDSSLHALLALPTFKYRSPYPAIPEPPTRSTEVETIQFPPFPEGVVLAVVQRTIRHLTVDEEEREEEDAKAYVQATAAVLSYICNLLDIHITELGSKPQKRRIFEAIQHLASLSGCCTITHSDLKIREVAMLNDLHSCHLTSKKMNPKTVLFSERMS
jgi:hypothetical protein